MKESNLAKIKNQYISLQKKYKLPSFSELNEDFEIEKLQERETDFLLRNVRRMITEKISNVLRFLELILNPSETPTPLFVFAMLKNISPETRKEIEVLYRKLSSIELSSLSLDINYNEKKEAELIKGIVKSWPKIKEGLGNITEKLEMAWSKEKPERKYLG